MIKIDLYTKGYLKLLLHHMLYPSLTFNDYCVIKITADVVDLNGINSGFNAVIKYNKPCYINSNTSIVIEYNRKIVGRFKCYKLYSIPQYATNILVSMGYYVDKDDDKDIDDSTIYVTRYDDTMYKYKNYLICYCKNTYYVVGKMVDDKIVELDNDDKMVKY